MRRLDEPTVPGRILDDSDLRELYAYPPELTTPWLRVNFVSSLDGAVAVDGRSGGLGTPADKQVFGLLRELADVILVGAGTARTENYGGARTSEALRERRAAAGLSPVPPIAVVTASGNLDPGMRLFTDTVVPPIVFTSARCPRRSVAHLPMPVQTYASSPTTTSVAKPLSPPWPEQGGSGFCVREVPGCSDV